MSLRLLEISALDWSFFIEKIGFLNVPLSRVVCKAVIQPHLDYVCTAWYPNLTKKLKGKLQVTQKEMHLILLEITMKGRHIKWTLRENELATNKSNVRTMCHLYSIQFCSK